jgi:peptidoglycan hydrolase-like amidase
MKWKVLFIVVAVFCTFAGLVRADADCNLLSGDDKTTCEDINRELSDLKRSLETNQGEASKLTAKLKSIQTQINVAVAKEKQAEIDIKDRSEKVSTQYVVLAVKTREMYKRLRSEPLWASLLSKTSMGESRRELAYRQDSNDRDKQIIVNLVQEIGKLEEDKKALEQKKIQLAKLQADLDKQNAIFQAEIKKISTKIAALSAQQQSLLAEKTGTFQTSVGDVPLADDPNSRPDYNPGFSPAFAAFSFGAPHFKGMSQYGAYGRSKAGQNAEDILKAYYGGVEIKKDYPGDKKIKVAGYGEMDIETYVKRVYEMPNSWGDNGGFEALKAQAVAARSYALAWTREGTGGAICTTEACQVYKNSNKGGKWEEAVNATRGWVLYKDGKIISAWYASTSGGYQESYNALDYRKDGSSYNTPNFWDTANGRAGWTSQAYEKTAGSPWFYKAWYKNRSGNSCGRSHPWLTSEEMADILNAIVVYKNGDASHIWPLDYQSCFGQSKDIWSRDQMKNEAKNKGGGFSSVSGVSVTYGENGVTANVHFDTDKGGFDVSGKDFYTVFNLRVSGRIALLSGLFNIEKK